MATATNIRTSRIAPGVYEYIAVDGSRYTIRMMYNFAKDVPTGFWTIEKNGNPGDGIYCSKREAVEDLTHIVRGDYD